VLHVDNNERLPYHTFLQYSTLYSRILNSVVQLLLLQYWNPSDFIHHAFPQEMWRHNTHWYASTCSALMKKDLSW